MPSKINPPINFIQHFGLVYGFFWVTFSVIGGTSATGQEAKANNPLEGVIDFHCHSGPDAVARSINDLDLVRLARDSGLRGIVLKSHYTMTADRAQLAMQEVGGIEVFGGVALNLSVGGINPDAVRRMIQFEGQRGQIVWLPTFDSENQVTSSGQDRPFVSVVNEQRPVAEVLEVFSIIAENDLILATGHSSIEETLLLVAEAKKIGVSKIVATHAMASPISATIEDMRKLAEMDVVIECTWLDHISKSADRISMEEYAHAIKTVGAEHFLISSDLGQAGNPLHPVGLHSFINGLIAAGLSDGEIDLITRVNPARLLGLQQ